MAGLDRFDGLRGALDRRLGKIGGMGVTPRLVDDGAQAKALGGVEGRGLQPTVIEGEALGLAVFQKQLAIIGAGQRVIDDSPDLDRIEAGASIKKLVGGAEVGHGLIFRAGASGGIGSETISLDTIGCEQRGSQQRFVIDYRYPAVRDGAARLSAAQNRLVSEAA